MSEGFESEKTNIFFENKGHLSLCYADDVLCKCDIHTAGDTLDDFRQHIDLKHF